MSAFEDYVAKYGQGSIRNGREQVALKIPRLMTDSSALDEALGGGLPLERPVLIWGLEGSFKTVLALKIAVRAQLTCRRCLRMLICCQCEGERTPFRVGMVEPDGHYDAAFAERLGVRVDSLKLVQPQFAQQSLDALVAVLEVSDLVIFDSLASLVPEQQGRSARANELAFERLVGSCVRAAVRKSVIFINRSRILGEGPFGHMEVRPGGHVQTNACGVEIKLRADHWEIEGGRPAVVSLGVEIRRNMSFAPRQTQLRVYFLENGRVPLGTVLEST